MTPGTTLRPATGADESTDPKRSSGFFVVWFPWVLLATTLAATALLAMNARKDAEIKAQAAFEHRATELQEAIAKRMQTYEEILRGVLGLFVASSDVQQEQWKRYIKALDLGNQFPGMLTIGYA